MGECCKHTFSQQLEGGGRCAESAALAERGGCTAAATPEPLPVRPNCGAGDCTGSIRPLAYPTQSLLSPSSCGEPACKGFAQVILPRNMQVQVKAGT